VQFGCGTNYLPIHALGFHIPGVEWPGCDVNNSRPVKVENQWSCTSAPPVPLWYGQGKTVCIGVFDALINHVLCLM